MPSWCERDLTYSFPFRQERAVGTPALLVVSRGVQHCKFDRFLTVLDEENTHLALTRWFSAALAVVGRMSSAGSAPSPARSCWQRHAARSMSKDAASSSLPAPLRAIVGVLTLALRAVQLVVRRRRHAPQHSPRLAHKRGAPQVATGLIYFIFCQGTMLAKEQKFIKKVPPIVNEVRAGSTTPLDACPSDEYARSACRGRTAAS